MEFTFGFLFGAAWGYCAWQARDQLSGARPQPSPRGSQWLPLIAMLLPAGLALAEILPSRFDYTLAGAVLLGIALLSDRAAWQIAITMTYCAFSIDFLQSRPALNQTALWAAVAVTTVGVAWWVDRRPGVRPLFLFLLLASLINSYCKAFAPPVSRVPPVSVELSFTLLALLAMAGWWRLRSRSVSEPVHHKVHA
jgi:hypothetical protein